MSFNVYADYIDMDYWRKLCVNNGKLSSYKKGEYFLSKGLRHKIRWGIIKSGYFKYTVISTNGEEHIVGFAFAGTFVGDYLSIISDNNDEINIVASVDSEVWICDREVLDNALSNNPIRCRTIVDNLFQQIYKSFLDLYRLSPKERYLELVHRCPDILQNVSLKEIASYLNITPTHLSRLRKEITFG